MLSKERKVKVTTLSSKPIAQTGAVNEKRNVILLTDGMNLFYVGCAVKRAQFCGESDIDHARHGHVLPCRVIIEALQIARQLGWQHTPFMRRQDDDFVPAGLHCARLMHINMCCLYSNDSSIRR